MKTVYLTLLVSALALVAPTRATADPYLCDTSAESCRARVLTLIANEKVGIDVSFWFMDDARYSNALVNQWKAGVPVRVIMDPRANVSKPANATILNQLQAAGIPMRTKSSGDIAHWKGMIFAGQHTAEFSGANYSPYEYLPQTPFIDYNDEVIYFSDEPDVVQSLMTHFDDVWTDYTGYADYANVVDPTVRTYPTFPIAPEFNFPPDDSYFDRLHPLMRAEAQRADGKIDVTMYRITDSRDADDMIFAASHGVPVRLYAEPNEYRNRARVDDSYNIDRMYMAGVQIRMRAHTGLNHQKTVILYSQGLTVFGTSNWSTASDDNQLEVNYFTSKTWFLQFFHDLFERKWNNTHILPDGTAAAESTAFKPLPPDKPVYSAPASAATGLLTSVDLNWNAGFWARQYDIYIGVTPTVHLLKANVNLGPSRTTTDLKAYTLPTLQPGTTYYWQIVSKTMANLTATGPVWSFTTAGTAPPNVCADPAASNYTGAAPCLYTNLPPGTPASASPANSASGVGLSPTLTWSASSATSYDVRFGTVNPPPPVTTGPSASYAPGTLAASTTYFWQIVARNAAGATTGPVWSFTTAAPPPPSMLPAPWTDGDIGAVGAAGTAAYASGAFSVRGAGADIWNAVDAFHFVYQPLVGDGVLVARVASIANVNQWSKAGVMIRNTLDANSAFAFMLVSSAKGSAFHFRTSAGATATGVTTGASAAPLWVKIARAGNTLSGSQSVDGSTWTPIGSTTIAMNTSVYVGLAVTSHNALTTAAGAFDNVALATGGAPPPPPPPPPPPVPAPWSDGDIGAVGVAGSASTIGTAFSVAGAGADIWNNADAFHYVFQPLSGDGQIVARVASVQNANAWSKAGVMIRDTLAPNSRYAFMLVSAAKGTAFQSRTTAGALAVGTTGTTATAPLWVKIARSGNTLSGYQSADGTTWQLVGSTSVVMGSTVEIGLAVTSHTITATSTAVFDNVAVSVPANQPPTVTLTAPANGTEFVPLSDIVLTASASDPENQLARVEFYSGTTLLGTATSAPFTVTWPAVPIGTYTLTAVAYDTAGAATRSTPSIVTVSATATPFFGVRNAFVIVLENHDWSDIVGNPLAPYINNMLLPQAAHAEHYFNPTGVHPSLPNYLWLEAGQRFGVADDGAPSVHHQATSQHLTTQLEAAGISWKAYEEGISGTVCPLTDSGLYAPKHNPFVYFDDVTDGTSATSAHCIAHVRPYSELAGDLQRNTVPRYTFITPDLCHDMHSCGVDAGDQWLSTELPKILASAAYQHAAVFITWDESEATGGVDGPIGMIALSLAAKVGYANTIPYTHSSTLRTIQEIFGLTSLLGDAVNATDLRDLFVP
jgi:phosphatidylserine/phosphatidylglycerophosphate/cardiolipin synthase-like enzyme/regulation of enolase protein 1 (concanavalin A-like superfamily)